jgi:hypothetical protein
MLPTFTPRQQPLQASCIDHLTIWDPERISRRTEDTTTVQTAFLDHHGVMGTLHLPIPPPEALSPPLARSPRVPLFRYPIPEPSLDGWKSEVAVDSHAAISKAETMGHLSLASLAHQPEGRPIGDALDPQCMETSILGLANEIYAILGESLAAATTMFPRRIPATHSKSTLPQHLWPKSVRHDVSNIRLIKHVTNTQECFQDELSPKEPSLPLWDSVATPLSLRTALSPPPKNLDALGILVRPDHGPMGTPTLSAAHTASKDSGRQPASSSATHATSTA